eukprot:1641255-Amphidinium_carterae.3
MPVVQERPFSAAGGGGGPAIKCNLQCKQATHVKQFFRWCKSMQPGGGGGGGGRASALAAAALDPVKEKGVFNQTQAMQYVFN